MVFESLVIHIAGGDGFYAQQQGSSLSWWNHGHKHMSAELYQGKDRCWPEPAVSHLRAAGRGGALRRGARTTRAPPAAVGQSSSGAPMWCGARAAVSAAAGAGRAPCGALPVSPLLRCGHRDLSRLADLRSRCVLPCSWISSLGNHNFGAHKSEENQPGNSALYATGYASLARACEHAGVRLSPVLGVLTRSLSDNPSNGTCTLGRALWLVWAGWMAGADAPLVARKMIRGQGDWRRRIDATVPPRENVVCVTTRAAECERRRHGTNPALTRFSSLPLSPPPISFNRAMDAASRRSSPRRRWTTKQHVAHLM